MCSSDLQKPHDHLFAVHRHIKGHAQVHLHAHMIENEAAVLVSAFFRDVGPAHDLEPADQGRDGADGVIAEVDHDAVRPEPDPDFVGHGFHMDIAGFPAYGAQNDGVGDFDDIDLVGVRLGAHGCGFFALGQDFVELAETCDADFYVLAEVVLGRGNIALIQRVGEGQPGRSVRPVVVGNESVLLVVFRGCFGQECGFRLCGHQVDNGQAELQGQNFRQLFVGEKPVLDKYVLGWRVWILLGLPPRRRRRRLALVGSSGSGKTTVARLAARFYDIKSGEILIGGINIKDFEKEDLMKKIAFVFQNSKLFKINLKDNLLIGKSDTTNEEINNEIGRAHV